jgi:hypothetical protein
LVPWFLAPGNRLTLTLKLDEQQLPEEKMMMQGERNDNFILIFLQISLENFLLHKFWYQLRTCQLIHVVDIDYLVENLQPTPKFWS